jgi:phosphatidylserine decarboxylase
MSVFNSLQSLAVPVHREGWRFVAGFAAVTLVLFWLRLESLAWLGVTRSGSRKK